MSESLRAAAWVAGLSTAVIAAALGAGGLEQVAWAFLGVAVASFGLGGWLSFRIIFKTLGVGPASRGAGGRSRMGASSPLPDAEDSTKAMIESVERQSNNLSRKLTSVEKQVRHLPYVTTELGRRHAQLIHDDLPMPVLGANWAATAPTVLFIVDEVLGGGRRRSIIECGSGASTIWTAAALRYRGEGHVITLEHDKRFAEQTRQSLGAHGLESWATVIDAPLVDQDIPDLGIQPWYDLTGLGDEHRFDLLFVDGPPGSTARLARYPAVPRLLPWLGRRAMVVADDTNRAPERKIVKMWSTRGAFDRPLSVVHDIGRSTALLLDT